MINISIKKPKPVLVMVHNASKGLRGVGLSGVTLDKDGNLIFTMSDGTVKTIKGYSQNLINTTNAVNKIKEEVSTMANNAADSAKKAKETADSIKQEYDRVEGATNSGLALIERSVLYGINRVKEATKTCKSDALANIELAHKDAIDDIAIRRLEALQDISETLGGQLAYFDEVSVDNDTLTFRRGSGDTHRLTIDYVQHAHNASSATKLETARTINIQDATSAHTGTGASFNGTANATIKLPNTIDANITGAIIDKSGLSGYTKLYNSLSPNYVRAVVSKYYNVDNMSPSIWGACISFKFSDFQSGKYNSDNGGQLILGNGVQGLWYRSRNAQRLSDTDPEWNDLQQIAYTTSNVASATKLETARTINVQDASASNTGTGASFDGSGNATIKLPAKIKATLNGNAYTATKTFATSTEDKSVLELVKGTTNNDWGAIRAGSTAKDAGYLEISTGDGGSEPIYARQISGAGGKETVTHEAALLDASGNTKFPGTVTAASFSGNASSATQLKTARTINVTDADGTNTGTGASFNGTNNATVKLPATIKANLTGNADTATKATNDGNGNPIASTYLPLSGGTLTGVAKFKTNNNVDVTSNTRVEEVTTQGLDKNNVLIGQDFYSSYAPENFHGIRVNNPDTTTGGWADLRVHATASGKCIITSDRHSNLTDGTTDNTNCIPTTAWLHSHYLPLSGGTLTGVVNGVTPTAGDNSTKIATTEFVNAKAGNYLPLSGGTINGDLSFTGGNRKITFNNGKSHVVGFGNGVYMYGDTADKQSSFAAFTNENGNGFQINAGDGTTQSRLVGKPDGTLTWNSQPLLPVGIVQAFAGTTIPSGWLLCDGSAVSRTTYANLYACIGTTYGAGNGSTTFNLPNLVDKFVEGSATAGTVKSAGLPNITGGGWNVGGRSTSDWSGAFKQTEVYPLGQASDGSGLGGGHIDFNASLSNSIYGNSNTVQPPALTMRYIIKY